MAPPGWKTIGRSTVARFGKFLTLETHRIELPDGRIIEDWPPQLFADITLEHLELALNLEPEILIIGTGRELQFPAASITALGLPQRVADLPQGNVVP